MILCEHHITIYPENNKLYNLSQDKQISMEIT